MVRYDLVRNHNQHKHLPRPLARRPVDDDQPTHLSGSEPQIGARLGINAASALPD
jgi:hypothetical protein